MHSYSPQVADSPTCSLNYHPPLCPFQYYLLLMCLAMGRQARPTVCMIDHQVGQPEGVSTKAIRSDHVLSPSIAKKPAICLYVVQSCPR